VTQYDIEVYQRVETLIGYKLPAFSCEENMVLLLLERVSEAQRITARELREQETSTVGRKKDRELGRGGDPDTTVRNFSSKKGKRRR
jgi:ATP-dependent RNA helicase DDX47/RRP3